ncbi:MAG TPA: class I SAM-dependent methyltransferase [Hyphomicrobiaceae bacterium]|nr:class I SAM-dependent methyltransferase [Hyphomicrobiaceae bacterium]
MSPRSIGLSEPLHSWLLQSTLREHAALQRLRAETAAMEHSSMQIAPEQGQLMGLLVRLINARRTLEIGTFTGYSALAVALAMPEDGRIIACDIDASTTAIAERHWRAAGVAHKIDLRIAPALQTIDGLLAEGAAGSFDMAFIDADKENYAAYYERCLSLVRPNGLILLDNMLWNGWVADDSDHKASTEAIRAITRAIRDDTRVDSVLVPIGDGLTIARKIG